VSAERFQRDEMGDEIQPLIDEMHVVLGELWNFWSQANGILSEVSRLRESGDQIAALDKLSDLQMATESMAEAFRFMGKSLRDQIPAAIRRSGPP
jgi:hypothetical protein